MLTLTQNILILIGVMTLSMLFMLVMNHFWPTKQRYAREDLIGWQLNILGSVYAVILGFMLFNVWNTFSLTQLNVGLEANALRNVYRLAAGLPEEQRLKLQAQTRAYAAAVIDGDWPAMERGNVPEKSHWVDQSMWATLMSLKSASPSESLAADHALSELSTLSQFRRQRLVQSLSRLPVIFWCVLLVGGVLTIISVDLFGSRYLWLHGFQVLSLTLLITLAMLAISDLNYPFRGWVHVNYYPFVRAQENMID
jgi:Protein of unknown function (DUF4239)